MFEYFNENDLISHNQSGLKHGDLCINLLSHITHEIYKSFVEGLFLDISKTLDKVWLQKRRSPS